MFHLHYDTRLDPLAETLAALLATRDGDDLLRPEIVLVPQPGLQRWLVQHLAERHGVAANLEFLAPAQFVWRVLRRFRPGLPEHSAFDREPLRWRLLRQWHDGLPPALAELLEDPADPLSRFQLAGHLARLYERYQGYRRDLLDGWERGDERGDLQAESWRTLAGSADGASRSRLLGDFLQTHAAAGAPAPDGLPPRLFAFGVINVSPDVLRMLGVIGRHAEMHFFLPTPCREYWGDVPDRRELRLRLGEFGGSAFDEPPNPLLVSLGSVGRDFVAQLFAYDEVQPDFESELDAAEPPRDTLLQRVQADVITLAAPDPAARLPAPAADDASLQVHVCHSPLREVQVLHDRLLDLLEREPDLQPRDIAVMVPDLARYAPCIEAAFGALEDDDPRRIPWTIADRPASDAHALVALFARLLALPASRLEAADVMEIIAVPAVMRRCGLDDDDLEQLQTWIVEAGVRWGEDADERAAAGLPAFEEFSWRFGRRRLLLGYMTGAAADQTLIDGVAPLTDIEGGQAAALGELLRVQRILRDLRTEQRRPRPPQAWQHLFNRALEVLLPAAEGRDEERALAAIHAALAALVEHTRIAGFGQPLDWMTVRAFLTEQLQDTRPQQRFLAGGVSVCGLVPLRNVPFRVICVLGLDAESFPRREPADALSRLHRDLIAGRRRPGDRSLRDDDRYLFLQTLMAARDVLYLSYTGIDLRDGSEREPSVVLAELIDTVCDGYFADVAAAREALITRQPMQPFSPHLFGRGDRRLFTYRDEWRAAAAAGRGQTAPGALVDVDWPDDEAGDADARLVSLDALRLFFRDPAREFLQQRARLRLAGATDRPPTREPLLPDPLQRALLERAVVERGRDGRLEDTLPWLRAQGRLPPLDWGEQAYAQTLDAVASQARRWHAWQANHAPQPARRFQLELDDGWRLQGVLDGRYDGGYADWLGSVRNGARWMHWWVGALVATALDGDMPCVAFAREHKDVPLRPPWATHVGGAARARELLVRLLCLRAEGQRTLLPLPPRSALAYAVAGTGAAEAALARAELAWSGSPYQRGERQQPWFELAFRGREPFADPASVQRFVRCCEASYVPLWRAVEQGVAL